MFKTKYCYDEKKSSQIVTTYNIFCVCITKTKYIIYID